MEQVSSLTLALIGMVAGVLLVGRDVRVDDTARPQSTGEPPLRKVKLNDYFYATREVPEAAGSDRELGR